MPVKFNQYWTVIPNRTKDYENLSSEISFQD